MSLLMYRLTASDVLIVTDTLSTDPSGTPRTFVSKCLTVPHLELVVVFTGVAQLGHNWSLQLQTEVLARDIDLLNLHVPVGLNQIASSLEREYGTLSSSTVYHFGYSEQQGGYVGYAYRSGNSFRVETIPNNSFGVKPEPGSQFVPPNNQEEMVALARQIRKEQNLLPMSQRLHVGGELCLTLLQDRSIQTAKAFRFEDFDDQWLIMNENLRG